MAVGKQTVPDWQGEELKFGSGEGEAATSSAYIRRRIAVQDDIRIVCSIFKSNKEEVNSSISINIRKGKPRDIFIDAEGRKLLIVVIIGFDVELDD
jgi:hypothetical protein